MKRIGVVGTMVWDTIYGRGSELEPVQEWGGISYALSALEAALPGDWEIVPLIKVGADLADRANRFLSSLTRRAGAGRFLEVPGPNNRVTIRYRDNDRRTECLSGGVPPWSWQELGPMVRDLDALYINFISGFEMPRQTALHLRHGFSGPIYADLHSLFLGVNRDGLREPQTLVDIASWFSCFDVVQLNEDEMKLAGGDPMEIAAHALSNGVRLLIVTLGPSGAVYFALDPFTFLGQSEPEGHGSGPIGTARVPAAAAPEELDPTGCGDVFGATVVASLVLGMDVEAAIGRANQYAARNLSYRGATHLHHHLRGEIVPT
ncbi:MAG: carbohydrate kinase family protein [Gemmatimonadales bacterium]